jgi:ribosome-associated toxin RatA of RatAB toxin-antitoxin module
LTRRESPLYLRGMALDAAQEVVVEIAASPVECFEVILDFESYPEWSSVIERARIVERDKHGIGRLVEFHLDMKVRSLRYVLEYAYKRSTELRWHSVEGDIQSIEGYYHFRKLGPTVTETTCRQEIQLGFWLPGPLRRLAERTALRQSVEEFKAAVEGRHTPKKKTPGGKAPVRRKGGG